MKITDYRRSTIGLILGTAANANAITGVSGSSNATATTGTVIVAISSNMFEWRDALSFGSNANDVGTASTMGSSPSNTRADHVHRGVSSVAVSSNTLYGGVALQAGTGIGITTTGQTIRIDGSTAIAAGTYLTATTGEQHVIKAHGNSGSSQTVDIGQGNYHTITLTANCTVGFSGWVNGVLCEIGVRTTEDGTGGWTPTFSGVTWLGGSAPTHTTTASTVTDYAFWSTDGGTTIYGGQVGAGSSFNLSHPSTSSNSFSSNVVITNDVTVAVTMPTFGTLHFSAPFFSEVVTSGGEIVWYGDDVVHHLVRLY